MDAVVLTNASSTPSFISLISETIEVIMEIDTYVEDVVIQKENFTLASACFNDLIPVLNQLILEKVPESGSLLEAIEILNVKIVSVKSLVLDCSQRSKVYLLMNCRSILNRLDATMKEIGYALSLINGDTLELSIDLVKEIEALSVAVTAAKFRISAMEEMILEKIETGIQERNFDCSYANGLVSLIAKAVEIPLERSAIRKMFEEFKWEVENISLRKEQAECVLVDQIVALLSRGDVTSTIDEKREKYLTKRNSLGSRLVEPLEAFYCPISGEVMINPVETSSGHTFERGKIEKWFAEGKDLCPLTMIPVDTNILRPNKNLRLAIEEWKDRNTIIKIGLLKQKLSESNPDILESLKQLQCICEEKTVHCEWVVFEKISYSVANLLEAKNRDVTKGALRVIGVLMKANDDVKEIVAGVDDIIPRVVRSLGRQAEERKLAISVLLEMSKDNTLLNSIGNVHGCILLLVTMSRSDDNQEANKAQELLEHLSFSITFTLQMAKANHFKPLLHLLSSGTEDVKMLMTRMLGEMELSSHSKSYLVENGVLTSLSPLISHENSAIKREAINAIKNLSTLPKNALTMIRQGVAHQLLQLLKSINFASQTCCEAVVTTIMNLCVAIKLQESDQVQVTLFENEDDVFRLVSLIGVTTSGVQQKVLRAFQALCHSPEAMMVKRVLMECSALRMLVNLCENDTPKVRSNAINLLSSVLEDCHEAALFESQFEKKTIEIISSSINSFDDDEDVAAAMSVIYNIPDTVRVRDWLREARTVSIICTVIKKRNKTEVLTEMAVGALSRHIHPTDLDAQKTALNSGIIPLLVTLLKSGTPVAKMRAAACMSQFSANSRALSNKARPRRKALACFLTSPERTCPIHEGICSIETSFCLLESNAIDPLVKILAEENEGAREASLNALLTLIDGPRVEEGCKVLSEAEAIPVIIKLLSSRSQSLQEKAVVASERIFRVAEYSVKYESSAHLALVDIASRGSLRMRSLAAKTLAHMHVLYDQSSYF